ncbi:MAG: hypothetical protein JST26_03085 [Bacteroidetes bacterium]|nr:hypothetical protein [Bacteroidota bacterium]
MPGWYKYFLQNKFQFIIPFIGFLFIVLAAYPGFMSPDSLDQYQQALAGVYSDWHPPVMAWFWNKLLWIKNGPQPMLILINLFYWSGVSLWALCFRRYSPVIFILAFFPPMINFLGVIWKDSLLFSILFFSCALWCFHTEKEKSRKPEIAVLVCIVLLLLFAACLRYNAMAAVAPLLFMVIVGWRDELGVMKKIGVGITTVALMYGMSVMLNRVIADNKTHPEQQLMLYDLMGIQYYTTDAALPRYVTSQVGAEAIPYIYKPNDGGGSAVFGYHCKIKNESDLRELKADWKWSLAEHPKAWLHHKWWVFKEFQKSSLPVYYYIHPNHFGFELHRNMFNQGFRSYIDNPVSLLFYHGWIYLLITLLVCILSLFCRHRAGMRTAFFIASSGALYSLAYLPLSPSADFRYHYWSIAAAFIGAGLFTKSFFNTKAFIKFT